MFLTKNVLNMAPKSDPTANQLSQQTNFSASKSTTKPPKLNSKRNQKPKIKPKSATEYLKHTCQQQLNVNFKKCNRKIQMMQATVEWPKSTFKSLKTTKTSHLATFHFVQFLEGVQPERSWDLTLEVQVDYFFTGFSVNTVVLLRVYNQQFQGNILCMVLETSRADRWFLSS